MSNTVSGDLLKAAAVTGDGPVFANIAPITLGSFQCEFIGAPTRVVVSIKGLIDGGTFDTLLTLDTDEGYLSGEIASLGFPALVRQLKASVDTLTGGTAPTVSCHFTAKV